MKCKINCYRVPGDSLSPAIKAGWSVFTELNKYPVVGEYVVVRPFRGQITVSLYHGRIRAGVLLCPISEESSPRFVPDGEIRALEAVGGILPPSKINSKCVGVLA